MFNTLPMSNDARLTGYTNRCMLTSLELNCEAHNIVHITANNHLLLYDEKEMSENLRCIIDLIVKGNDIDTIDNYGEHVLDTLTKILDVELCTLLIIKYKYLDILISYSVKNNNTLFIDTIDAYCTDGKINYSSILRDSIHLRYDYIAELLLSSGVYIDPVYLSYKYSDGSSLLYSAYNYKKSPNTIITLIKLGGDVNSTDQYGNTILSLTCYEDNKQLVKFMIEQGADVNSRNIYGETPLHNVKSVSIAKLLVKNKADVNAATGDNMTILYKSALENNYVLIEYLIRRGADCSIMPIFDEDEDYYDEEDLEYIY